MTPRLPTASGVARALACPLSCQLPRERYDSAAAERGRARHAELAEALLNGTTTADGYDPRAVIGVPDGAEIYVEQAFVWDASDGEAGLLGVSNREYPAPSRGQYYGTADAVIVLPDRVCVVDWKTGAGDVGPAASNAQLATLALMACRAFARDRATVAIVYTARDAERAIDRADLDASALARHHTELRALHLHLESALAMPPNTGDHCRYCESKPWCPAYTTDAREIETADTPWLERVRAEIERDPGTWYERRGRMREIVDAIDSALVEYARAHDGMIPLPDGRTAKRVDVTRRNIIDGRRALTVLAEQCGAAAAESVAVKVSLGDITDAARKHAPTGVTKQDAERMIGTALDDAGVVERSMNEQWKVIR